MSDPEDLHIGARLKARRKELKRSQAWLGEHVGVTFQQVQKYEKGLNRISASQLQVFAQALQKPVSYFYRTPLDSTSAAAVGFGEPPSLPFDHASVESAIARIALALRALNDANLAGKLAELAEAIQHNKTLF